MGDMQKKTVKTFDVTGLRDKRLSFKARGVLAYLLSKPLDWQSQMFELKTQSEIDGIKSIRSAMRELVKFGYAELKTTSAKGGKFTGKYYKIYETPRF